MEIELGNGMIVLGMFGVFALLTAPSMILPVRIWFFCVGTIGILSQYIMIYLNANRSPVTFSMVDAFILPWMIALRPAFYRSADDFVTGVVPSWSLILSTALIPAMAVRWYKETKRNERREDSGNPREPNHEIHGTQ